MKVLTVLIFVSAVLAVCFGQGGHCPDGWSKLRDEKCYLLVTTYSTYSGAKETCAARQSTLALIKEQEQQDFLTNFIFNQSQVELGVWIGATRTTGNEFVWEDGSNIEFFNWGEGSPSSDDGRDCVAMQSSVSRRSLLNAAGQWKDVSCNIVNYFVCEKVPAWSNDDILRVLIDTRKKLGLTAAELDATKARLSNNENELAETKEKLAIETGKVEDLQRNPVPVGFIYYEHHGQPSPQAIWPGVTWTDVTASYAGLFFRALGGGSAEFGSVQEPDVPRLTNVDSMRNVPYSHNIGITPGTWSDWIYSGNSYGQEDGKYNLRFLVNNPEIRPRNSAIRIWRREA